MKNKPCFHTPLLPLYLTAVALLSFSNICFSEDEGLIYSEDAIGGIVQPGQKALLSFAQTGQILIMPKEGQQVSKGDVIAQLDNEQLKLAVEEAGASEEAAQVSVEINRHNMEKTQRLLDEKILSPVALKEDEFNLKQAQADLKIAEAGLKTAELALKQSTLFAPFDGIIINVEANYGEQVPSGQTIAELVNLDSLCISVEVPEEMAKRMEKGMTTDVWVSGKKAGKARLKTILPLLDPASGLQKVIWDVTSNEDILSGYYVTLNPFGNQK